MTPPITRSQFTAAVKSNVSLCREHYRLVLALPSFPATLPGQFVQLACRNLRVDYSPEFETVWEPGTVPSFEGRELLGPLAMLRRPFSLAGRRDRAAGVELDVIHRVVGVGTNWLSRLAPGDEVQVLGPLGNRFSPPTENGLAILVGGGVGIPPMLYLAAHLEGSRAIAFCGATTRDLLPLTLTSGTGSGVIDETADFELREVELREVEPRNVIAEFTEHGIPSVVATDDGTFGFRGFVTQALEAYLDRRAIDSSGDVIYTCGPEPMMKRVADIAARRGIACQVAVERAMACGMGTCQSCCIKVRTSGRADGREWVYRLACTDGPVFLGADLLW